MAAPAARLDALLAALDGAEDLGGAQPLAELVEECDASKASAKHVGARPEAVDLCARCLACPATDDERGPAHLGAVLVKVVAARDDVLFRLVRLARENGAIAERAVWALANANVCLDCPRAKDRVPALGGLRAAVDCCGADRDAGARERGAQAVDALCAAHGANQERVCLEGGAPPLLALLRDPKATGNGRLRAAFATHRLASNAANAAAPDAGAHVALGAALEDHVANGVDSPRGLGHEDGAVAAAARALPKGGHGAKNAVLTEAQADLCARVVAKALTDKAEDDAAGRAMRLRDFTIAARALAGHVGPREAAKLATALADPLVACLAKDAWTARGAGGEESGAYRALCLGDAAGAALERVGGADRSDGRLADAVDGALHHLRGGGDDAGAAALGDSKKYHLFISHKQSDAKDFARALHTMFTLRGLHAFIDMEYAGDLGTLEDIVRASVVLVFILSDYVLDSPWCVSELSAAVAHGVPVVVVKKEGSRWRDPEAPESTARCLNFPSYAELAKLPPAARDVFQIKTVEHSDVYYASFIDKLFERLAEAGVADGGGGGDEPGTPGDPFRSAPTVAEDECASESRASEAREAPAALLRDLADALRESRGPAPEVHVTVAAPRLADVVLAAAVASAVSCGVCATFFFLVVAPRL
ncbi:hypothetical protein JL722_4526 [Aureococcus anophagefferens]|nr:hypothetical protein JL722_4526 [Aureococcus anophagefferens]